jgi:lysozyme family protein
MADFETAYKKVLSYEGGYVNDPDDPGGETYKGIARKMNSKWDGWVIIDLLKLKPGFPGNLDKDTELQNKITDFYHVNYWDAILGDKIKDQEVATSIFDFAVNAGVKTSACLAQFVVEAASDGIIGSESIAKINGCDPEHFLASFTIAKILRYINIVEKNQLSRKYFYGWVRRAVGKN